MSSRGAVMIGAILGLVACQAHLEPVRRGAGGEGVRAAGADPAAPAPASEGVVVAEPVAVETFATAAEAFAAILEREPDAEVVALGEAHRTKGAPALRTSLSRFTGELLPLLEGRASDLVIETWVAEAGGCGERAREVAADVQAATRRPSETEQEIIALIEGCRERGVQPHILEMSCEDYQTVFVNGEVDYDRMLRVLARLMREKAIRLRDLRARRAGRRPSTVVIYGGHLHNDLSPDPELAEYSFGPALQRQLVGYYVEVDLFVPELIEGDERLARQPWFAELRARRHEPGVMLFRREPGSYVLVLDRTAVDPP